MPCYPELSIKNLYIALKDDKAAQKYLPDAGKRQTEREFVWHVVNTLRPEFVKDAIRKAQVERRKVAAAVDEQRNVI